MVNPTVLRSALTWGAVKGSVLGSTVSLMDLAFWKQLVLVLVSGILGVIGVVLGSAVAAREARKTRRVVRDVGRKVEADRREGDKPQEPRS